MLANSQLIKTCCTILRICYSVHAVMASRKINSVACLQSTLVKSMACILTRNVMSLCSLLQHNQIECGKISYGSLTFKLIMTDWK